MILKFPSNTVCEFIVFKVSNGIVNGPPAVKMVMLYTNFYIYRVRKIKNPKIKDDKMKPIRANFIHILNCFGVDLNHNKIHKNTKI